MTLHSRANASSQRLHHSYRTRTHPAVHVLPKGFHRIRPYGLFGNGDRAANIARPRKLLRVAQWARCLVWASAQPERLEARASQLV